MEETEYPVVSTASWIHMLACKVLVGVGLRGIALVCYASARAGFGIQHYKTEQALNKTLGFIPKFITEVNRSVELLESINSIEKEGSSCSPEHQRSSSWQVRW